MARNFIRRPVDGRRSMSTDKIMLVRLVWDMKDNLASAAPVTMQHVVPKLGILHLEIVPITRDFEFVCPRALFFATYITHNNQNWGPAYSVLTSLAFRSVPRLTMKQANQTGQVTCHNLLPYLTPLHLLHSVMMPCLSFLRPMLLVNVWRPNCVIAAPPSRCCSPP